MDVEYPVRCVSPNWGADLGEEQNQREFSDKHTNAQGWEIATTLSVLLVKVTTLYSTHNKGKTTNSLVILGFVDITDPYYSFCLLIFFK